MNITRLLEKCTYKKNYGSRIGIFCEGTAGVFHDPKEKAAVATNGYIILVSHSAYKEEYAGKSVKGNKVIEGGFPGYINTINGFQHNVEEGECKEVRLSPKFGDRLNAYKAIKPLIHRGYKATMRPFEGLEHEVDCKYAEFMNIFSVDGAVWHAYSDCNKGLFADNGKGDIMIVMPVTPRRETAEHFVFLSKVEDDFEFKLIDRYGIAFDCVDGYSDSEREQIIEKIKKFTE